MTNESAGVAEAPSPADAIESPAWPAVPTEDGGGRPSTGRRVVLAAAALIVAQLLVRAAVALSAFFSQDDLILIGRTATEPLTADFVLGGHDRHFMPGGMLLTAALNRLAPLDWTAAAGAVLVLQLLASVAVWRLIRVLLGSRPVALLPLLLFLFSPLALPASSSWSTAITALPLQAGLAWVCGDALMLERSGRVRYAISGTLAFAVALACFEKAVLIPLVAFAAVTLVLRQSGATAPVLASLRRGLWLWIGLVLVAAGWFWRFSSVVGAPIVDAERSGTVATAADAVGLGIFHGVLPGLFGGPLFWTDLGPWAEPPTAAVVAAAAGSLVVVAWTSWRRRNIGVVWWLVAGYIAVGAVLLVLRQLSVATPAELVLSLRDFPDTVVVVALAVCLVARAPARVDGLREVLNGTERRDVAVVAAVVFLGVSLWSSATYAQAVAADPTREYVTNATQALTAGLDAPLLDDVVPAHVVWAPASPYNRLSRVFAPLGVEVGLSTPELKILDDAGRLVDGRVSDERELFVGPVPGCGHLVTGPARTGVALNGPMVVFDWTVQLNYLASRNGWIDVSFTDGETVRAPVVKGAHSVYLDVHGGGDSLQVSGVTSGLSVCIDTGLVGLTEAAG